MAGSELGAFETADNDSDGGRLVYRDMFLEDIGDTIEEIVVGTGPCGELRYPSYVEANGWRFPGVRSLPKLPPNCMCSNQL